MGGFAVREIPLLAMSFYLFAYIWRTQFYIVVFRSCVKALLKFVLKFFLLFALPHGGASEGRS